MKKTIILGTILAGFLMLMMPNISAIEYNQINEKIEERIINNFNIININIKQINNNSTILLLGTLLITFIWILIHSQSAIDYYVTYGSLLTKVLWSFMHYFLPLMISLLPFTMEEIIYEFGEENIINWVLFSYLGLIVSSSFFPSIQKMMRNNPTMKNIHFILGLLLPFIGIDLLKTN